MCNFFSPIKFTSQLPKKRSAGLRKIALANRFFSLVELCYLSLLYVKLCFTLMYMRTRSYILIWFQFFGVFILKFHETCNCKKGTKVIVPTSLTRQTRKLAFLGSCSINSHFLNYFHGSFAFAEG